jgi:hypothetical protein
LVIVGDLVAVELERVGVVAARALARRREGTAVAAVGAAEHCVHHDAVAFGVGAESPDLVRHVAHEGVQALHPVAVGLDRGHLGECFGLGGECSVGVQYRAHSAQPWPDSHASKKAAAVSAMVLVAGDRVRHDGAPCLGAADVRPDAAIMSAGGR